MIDGKNLFDHPVKSDMGTYDNIRKIVTGQRDDYTTCCLLDCVYFKNYFKMIAIDLSKKDALDADAKVIQQSSFTGNVDQARHKTMFFIIKEANETILDCSKGTVSVL